MKYLSLFSGIEAATVAWHPFGWECVAVSEIEPFPCAVLKHHYPTVPNLGDVTKITEADIAALGPIDIVVFGSPCQDLSVAGQRKGLINEQGDITRSGLFFSAINIFHWAREHCGARFALWENVPGAFSSSEGRDFASVVSFMAGIDSVDVPKNSWGTEGAAVGDNGLLEWAVLDAQWFGVAQRRRRVFAVLDTGNWSSRPPILLESKSLRGDTAPSRETGQVAPTIPSRSLGGGGLGTDCDGGLIPQPFDIANTLTQRMYKGINTTLDEGQTPVIVFDTTQITHPENRSNPVAGGPCHPLSADAHPPAIAFPAIAFPANLSGTQYVSTENLSPMIGAKNPIAVATVAPDALVGAFKPGQSADARSIGYELNIAPSLEAGQGGNNKPAVHIGMQVRRLTPVECERLQGFPDNYTAIPWRGKLADQCPDGPRYKALGNSMAVPVMHWIGGQIQLARFCS